MWTKIEASKYGFKSHLSHHFMKLLKAIHNNSLLLVIGLVMVFAGWYLLPLFKWIAVTFAVGVAAVAMAIASIVDEYRNEETNTNG